MDCALLWVITLFERTVFSVIIIHSGGSGLKISLNRPVRGKKKNSFIHFFTFTLLQSSNLFSWTPLQSKDQETLPLPSSDSRCLIARCLFPPPLFLPSLSLSLSLSPPSLSFLSSLPRSVSVEVWLPAQPRSLFGGPEAPRVSVPEGQHWQAASASQEGASRSALWTGTTHTDTRTCTSRSTSSFFCIWGQRWISQHMNTWECIFLCVPPITDSPWTSHTQWVACNTFQQLPLPSVRFSP